MSTLEAAIAQLGMAVPAGALPQIEAYCQKLWSVNEVMNLTRHTTPEQFVNRDLLDTLQLSQLIPSGHHVLDIGSGGGVPGLLLAILRPDLRITLTDSVGKKARALEELAAAARIEVEVFDCRAESLLDDFRYDTTTARAVGPLARMLTWLEGRWVMAGQLLAVKGPKWLDEVNEAKQMGLMNRVTCEVAVEYDVPGESWKSTILRIRSRARG